MSEQVENVVLTMGAFDMFHSGHVSLLNSCKKIAGVDGVLIVGVNSDEFLSSYKRDPILPYNDRVKVVQNHRAVDRTFLIDKHDMSSEIKALNPDFIVVGSDWATRDYLKQIGLTLEELLENDIVVLYKHLDHEITTTQIIEKVRSL